jgi:hypothetical protein
VLVSVASWKKTFWHWDIHSIFDVDMAKGEETVITIAGPQEVK